MMNEAYTKLMMQQELSQEADAAFYEKLEQASPGRKTRSVLKVAAIAACVLLLIPVTAWAVENIFGVAIIKHEEGVNIFNQPGIGYKIKFDNVESRPITDFSEHLQVLDKSLVVSYDSWEEAEEALGIDLLSNSICTDDKTTQFSYYVTEGNPLASHCEGTYRVKDNQLYLAGIGASYQRSGVKFIVSATITAIHPTITEEQLLQYHGASSAYLQHLDPGIATEQYTTQCGIPVTIVVIAFDDWQEYTAHFAVNDISYKVRII